MAKRKSIYDKPLKDINKDGKKNFKDTWLGDAIGADGKAGVQGPGMKASLKGERRGAEKSEAKTRPKARPEKSDAKTDTDKKKRVYSGRGKAAGADPARDRRTGFASRATPGTVKVKAGAGNPPTQASTAGPGLAIPAGASNRIITKDARTTDSRPTRKRPTALAAPRKTDKNPTADTSSGFAKLSQMAWFKKNYPRDTAFKPHHKKAYVKYKRGN